MDSNAILATKIFFNIGGFIMKKTKILVTCCLLISVLAFPITGNAMERYSINPLTLSEDPSVVPTENSLLLGLLQEDIKRYELEGEHTEREQELKKLWVEAHWCRLSDEEILRRITEVAEELLSWQRDEVSCYLGMDDESLQEVINHSNMCYEGVYQILRVLDINADYLTLDEMRQM